MLNVNNLLVKYGNTTVLRNVSISVNKGEIISIIGSNGAGKSTLLKAIVGIVPVAYGTIYFKGSNVTFIKPEERISMGIAYVPEGRKLFSSLTVMENLEIGAFISRARRKKDYLLDYVFKLFPELKKLKTRNASTLSGGEGQMLNIARGLMSDPDLILFDEISLGLAPVVINRLYKAIEEINSTGISVVLVEQNIAQSLRVCDRFYLLTSGTIKLSGKPDEYSLEKIKNAYFGGIITD